MDGWMKYMKWIFILTLTNVEQCISHVTLTSQWQKLKPQNNQLLFHRGMGRHTTDHTDPMSKKVNLNVCCYLCFETITQFMNATFYSARSMDTSIYTYKTKKVWSMVKYLKSVERTSKVGLEECNGWQNIQKKQRKEPVCMVYTCCWAGSPAPSDCPPSRPLSLMLFHLSANNQTPAHSSTPMDMQIMDWTFFFFFLAVPSSVPTSEALLPRRSSRHPPLQNEMTTFPICGLQSTVAFVENKLLEGIN